MSWKRAKQTEYKSLSRFFSNISYNCQINLTLDPKTTFLFPFFHHKLERCTLLPGLSLMFCPQAIIMYTTLYIYSLYSFYNVISQIPVLWDLCQYMKIKDIITNSITVLALLISFLLSCLCIILNIIIVLCSYWKDSQ